MNKPLRNVAMMEMASDFKNISDTYSADVDDYYGLLREARIKTPVREGDLLAEFGVPSQADFANSGRKVFTLFRHDDITWAMRDQEHFDSSLLQDGLGNLLDGVLLTAMSGAQHHRLRTMLQQCFTPMILRDWRERVIEPVIREQFFRPLARRGKAELLADVLLMFPLRAIYEIIGFPPDEDMIVEFSGLALKVLAGPQRDPEMARIMGPRALQATQTLFDKILPIVSRRRADGAQGSDLIAFLLRAQDPEGNRLDDVEITNLIRGLLPAAGETTTRSMANLIVILLERPALIEALRGDRTLVSKVINESLRYQPTATFLARLVTKDVDIRGVHIPAGAAVSLATGSGNRDEEVFEHGDEFDHLRPMRPLLSFGAGPHTCLGMSVAKIEMEIALNAMLDFMPGLRADPDYPRPEIKGVQLRGPTEIHAVWEPGAPDDRAGAA